MSDTSTQGRPRQTNWLNVSTVCSAAILIAAEVFGGAFAAGWAFATLFELGDRGALLLQATFFLIGIYVMFRFVQHARRIEPFTK
jgi:hypothetical protein